MLSGGVLAFHVCSDIPHYSCLHLLITPFTLTPSPPPSHSHSLHRLPIISSAATLTFVPPPHLFKRLPITPAPPPITNTPSVPYFLPRSSLDALSTPPTVNTALHPPESKHLPQPTHLNSPHVLATPLQLTTVALRNQANTYGCPWSSGTERKERWKGRGRVRCMEKDEVE